MVDRNPHMPPVPPDPHSMTPEQQLAFAIASLLATHDDLEQSRASYQQQRNAQMRQLFSAYMMNGYPRAAAALLIRECMSTIFVTLMEAAANVEVMMRVLENKEYMRHIMTVIPAECLSRNPSDTSVKNVDDYSDGVLDLFSKPILANRERDGVTPADVHPSRVADECRQTLTRLRELISLKRLAAIAHAAQSVEDMTMPEPEPETHLADGRN